MVQFRRLDPLANAGPYQRLTKSPVKSFTLTEAQYEKVSTQRPELLVTFRESAVIAVPNRDLLEIHYAFPDIEQFHDNFGEMFTKVIEGSSREEAPRGIVLGFRDRPNRPMAETVFWSIALDEGPQWVEMNLIAVSEQESPSDTVAGGYSVREPSESDFTALVAVEAEASGRPRLTDAGLATFVEYSRWVRLVVDNSGAPAAALSFSTQPGGWGIIESIDIRSTDVDALRKPLLEWSIGFLRSNGGRRIRKQAYTDNAAEVALLRDMGFTPGETGLDYTRPVDWAEIQSKIDERQAHGTLIKFGDWR